MANIISEVTEIVLLVIGLIITWYAFVKVRRHYTKVIPQTNMFDIVLEIVSQCGVYFYSVNSLIALVYSFFPNESKYPTEKTYQDFLNQYNLTSISSKSTEASKDDVTLVITNAIAAVAALISILQSTLQTLFILECLRRYAQNDIQFMQKPARELITTLLITNLSLWFYDTFSAKRFDTKAYLIDHFGILKWSIVNAFSSPLAIFYRFHSSVCLSDIW